MRGGFPPGGRTLRTWRGLALLTLLGSVIVWAGIGPSSASSEIEVKLPADIIYSRVPGSDSAVVFSHESHAAFADNNCLECHPQPFRMLQRGPTPTHAEMNNDASCGICHNGEKAFDVRDAASCLYCHAGVPAAEAAGAAGGTTAATTGASTATSARKLPKPHAYPPGESSPGPVTFRHETHMKDEGGCTACHPKLFRMAATPPLPEGGMHEAKACGACHDGTKAFAAEDTDSCLRCHQENGARP